MGAVDKVKEEHHLQLINFNNFEVAENKLEFNQKKIQGFCVADFAALFDEMMLHWKIFLLFDTEPCVRKSEATTRSKVLRILQTELCFVSFFNFCGFSVVC